MLYPDSETVHGFTSPTSVRILSASDSLEMPDLLPGYSVSVKSLFADAGSAAALVDDELHSLNEQIE